MRVCSFCQRCYDDSVMSCLEEDHPDLSDLREGICEMIGGYRIEFLVDSFGSSEIYQGRELNSGQPCVIKILSDRDNCQRFLDDAKAAAAFFHPNVSDIYGIGELDGGESYIVAEWPNGQTLRELLNDVGLPSLMTAVEVARQTAEALHALHQRGLTHRAINPGNIVLTTGIDQCLVVKIQNPDLGGICENALVSNRFLNESGLYLLRYFAPEQCAGDGVTPQTDIYSLGIVFYEMLAGAAPFEGQTAAALINAHKNQPPPEIKIANFDLRMLLTHSLTESLHKRPASRQSSANALARQLRHIEQLSTHTSTPPPAGAIATAPQKPVAVFAAAAAPAAIVRTASVAKVPKADVYETITTPRLEAEPRMAMHEPLIGGSAKLVIGAQPLTEPAPLRRSRLKVLKKQLRRMAVPQAIEVPTREPILAVPLTKIEWDDPLDIPSAADVLGVLTSENRPPAPVFTLKPEPDPDPEEITQVRGNPIRIEWDRPLPPAQFIATQAAADLPFFPTILGGRERSEIISLDRRNSVFAAYNVPPRKHRRALAVGAGFIALVGIFLFGNNEFVRQYVQTLDTSDSVDAKSIPGSQAFPKPAPPSTSKKKVVKTSDKALVPEDDRDTKTSSTKPAATVNSRTPAVKAAYRESTPKPALRSTIVIYSENGRTKSRIEPAGKNAEKTPRSDRDNSRLTRPRIVKDSL